MTKPSKDPAGIDARYVIQMNTAARLLDDMFKGHGFCLLVFPFAEINGRVNYISNAERRHMLQAMKEFIARAEGRLAEDQSLQ